MATGGAVHFETVSQQLSALQWLTDLRQLQLRVTSCGTSG